MSRTAATNSSLTSSRDFWEKGSVAVALPLTLGLALWLLWPGITGPFIFDDFPNLQNLRELGDQFTRESIGRYLAAWQGNPGRPLAAISFLIEDHAWPTDPEAFKRNNLLWHLLVGIGIFALGRKLADLYPHSRDGANWIALVAMAFWLIHPMQLSATMLVVQRMTIFSNGLMVAGLLAYLHTLISREQPKLSTAILAIGILAVFGALAFLAKENGALIFAYAAALNLTLAAPLISRFPAFAQRLLWLGTFGVTILLVLGLLWQVRDPAAAYAFRDFSLTERLLTQPRVLFDYLFNIVLPSMSTGVFYDNYPISRGLLSPWTTMPALIGISGAIAASIGLRRRYPLASFAVLWFLAGHLIESTVIPLEIYFEHRNYLAMLGPILAIVIGLFKAPGSLRIPMRSALLAWLAVTAFIGHFTARSWGDELAQAEIWVIERPQSPRAVQTLASAYAKLGFFKAAYNILQRGRSRIPKADELIFQHALLDCISGNASNETFAQLTEVAETASWARAIPNVIAALRTHARPNQCEGALTPEMYRQMVVALLNNPNFRGRAGTVGHLLNELGMFYLDIGKPAAALEQFRHSFQANPDPQIAINEANIAIYLGRLEYAEDALKRAVDVQRPLFKQWLYPVDTRADPVRARIETLRHEQNSIVNSPFDPDP